MLRRTKGFWGNVSLAFVLGARLAIAETAPIEDPQQNPLLLAQAETEVEIPSPSGAVVATPDVVSGPAYRSGAIFNDTEFYQLQVGAYTGETTAPTNNFMSLEGRGGVFANGGQASMFVDGRLQLNEYSNLGERSALADVSC